jgi:hypothetical protein
MSMSATPDNAGGDAQQTIAELRRKLDVIDVERMRIDPAKLDAIARLGGNTCCTIRDRFEMLTPTLDEYNAGLARDCVS